MRVSVAIDRPLTLYLIMLAVVALIVIIGIRSGQGIEREVAGWTFPFIGTFLGALLAFRLEEIRERERVSKVQAEAINRALIVLIAQVNELWQINQELEKYQGWGRLFNLRAIAPPDRFDLRQKVEELAFLVGIADVNVLLKLEIEQRRFDMCVFAMQCRSDLLVNTIQPLLAAAKLNHRLISEHEFRATLGEFNFGQLETATSNVYDNVPASVESIPALMAELHAIGKEIFPERKIIKFEGFSG